MSVCIYSVFVLSCVHVASFEGLIPCPRSPTVYVKGEETERAAKAQQMAVYIQTEPSAAAAMWGP
jgi:uroporphyrinogen-III synthase